MANQIYSKVMEYRPRSLAGASVLLIVGFVAFLALLSIRALLGYLERKQTHGNEQSISRGRLCNVAVQDTGEVAKESDFPQGWWISEELLELERRAIFSKKPVGLAHANMFEKPGSYHTVDHPAGYPLFLIKGRDHVLRCFHNVCRHRAYPVVSTKTSGCAFVLGCKYHGWSYDLKGNLTKAPKFDHLENFNKKTNSLLGVNVVVADDGTILVDVGTAPNKATQPYKDQTRTRILEKWEVEGVFNWKLAGMYNLKLLPLKDH